MDSDHSEKETITPRRSRRIQKIREVTPEPPTNTFLGPRKMMKAKQTAKSPVQVTLTNSSSKRKNKTRVLIPSELSSKDEENQMDDTLEKKTAQISESNDLQPSSSCSSEDSTTKKEAEIEQKVESSPVEADPQQETSSKATTNEKEIDTVQKIPVENLEKTDILTEPEKESGNTEVEILQEPPSEPTQSTDAPENMNETPLLMDESIISVTDSPLVSEKRPKDSTFSPVVDASIHDSRPVIDPPVKLANGPLKSFPFRTSTPLAPKVTKTLIELSSLAQSSEAHHSLVVRNSVPDFNTISEESKYVNPLEKSILKNSRRKRSFSVTEAESFMQRRVMFVSPQIMGIDAIDEKMKASFVEEKENSMMREAANSSRRKRSLSTSSAHKAQTPLKIKERSNSRFKMPNFSAIHERQFEKMESIQDHHLRKVERAKKLGTPQRTPTPTPPSTQDQANTLKSQAASKIPKLNARKPLSKVSSTENIFKGNRRALKRSLSTSDEPAGNSKKVAVVSALQRTKSEDNKGALGNAVSFSHSVSRTKVDERREKNISLYKTNQCQRTASNSRARNANLLKGVRLNRRFELQMQHRLGKDDSKDES